jgi:hypothetical protein
MDFEQDPDVFPSYLGMVKRDWAKAVENFVELATHWEQLSGDFFPGVSVKRADDGCSLEGDVVGKRFSVEIKPLAFEKACFAEALVFVKFSDEIKVEAARFLLNRRGFVVDSEGAVQVDTEDGEGSARIFASVIRTVIQLPTPDTKAHK